MSSDNCCVNPVSENSIAYTEPQEDQGSNVQKWADYYRSLGWQTVPLMTFCSGNSPFCDGASGCMLSNEIACCITEIGEEC